MQFNWTVTMGPEERRIPCLDDALARGRKVGFGLGQQFEAGINFYRNCSTAQRFYPKVFKLQTYTFVEEYEIEQHE
jgi:hypothetical protein